MTCPCSFSPSSPLRVWQHTAAVSVCAAAPLTSALKSRLSKSLASFRRIKALLIFFSYYGSPLNPTSLPWEQPEVPVCLLIGPSQKKKKSRQGRGS